jgi:hypothetical protein
MQLETPIAPWVLPSSHAELTLVHGSENHLFTTLHSVSRAAYPEQFKVENMPLDQGTAHVPLAREFLDCADGLVPLRPLEGKGVQMAFCSSMDRAGGGPVSRTAGRAGGTDGGRPRQTPGSGAPVSGSPFLPRRLALWVRAAGTPSATAGRKTSGHTRRRFAYVHRNSRP